MAVATLINLVAFVLILLSFPFDASKVSRSQDFLIKYITDLLLAKLVDLKMNNVL